MVSPRYRRRRKKKKDAMGIVLVVMLVIIVGIVAIFIWDSRRDRFYEDMPTYEEPIGLGDSEDDAIGPQYSEEKKAFIEWLNQMMRFKLEMDSIE